MSAAKKLAYSYIRFSTPQQAEGHSLERQSEMAETYCKRRGWTLSPATYRDLGVSAWQGKNALVGNLGEFLKAIDSKAVNAGSALIVESLDRITRQGIDEGYDLIKKILKSGVLLVTLSPEREFDSSATRSLSKGALEIQLILERAAEESERKSERVGKAWAAKKRRAAEKGEPVTARTPAWLRLVDGQWEIDHKAAETIRRIYCMARDGHGLGVITKKLNAEKVPVVGRAKHWARSYVAKLLTNRAVVGEYQPYKGRSPNRVKDGKPIQGYFPAVITEDQWYATRAALTSRRGKVGRLPKEMVNVFNGLLHDLRDGGSMQLVNKGKKGGGRSLVSYKAVQGVKGSYYASFPFGVFERAVLTGLKEINPQAILPERGEEDRVQVLRGRIAEEEGEIEKIKDRLRVKYSNGLADVLDEHEDNWKRLNEELSLALQEAASPLENAWDTTQTLIGNLDKAADPIDARFRLRSALRRVIDRIHLLATSSGSARLAVVHIDFTGNRSRDYFLAYRPVKANAASRQPGKWRMESWAYNLPEQFPVLPDGTTFEGDLTSEHMRDFPEGGMEVMLLDLEQRLQAWYEAVRDDPKAWNPLPE